MITISAPAQTTRIMHGIHVNRYRVIGRPPAEFIIQSQHKCSGRWKQRFDKNIFGKRTTTEF